MTDLPLSTDRPTWTRALPWVAPFAVFLLLLAALPALGLPPRAGAAAWFVVLVPVLAVAARALPSLRPARPVTSTLVGLGVLAVWLAPDLLVSGWREHWLFQNSVTGSLRSSLDADARGDAVVLALRTLRAALLVPLVEELFWRGWLARWLQDARFERVPMGRWTPTAFAIVAVLFAAEHGPYWEVGLLAGVIYNWWLWRTRTLGDLVLAHAVTNAALSAYVMATGRWELWQ